MRPPRLLTLLYIASQRQIVSCGRFCRLRKLSPSGVGSVHTVASGSSGRRGVRTNSSMILLQFASFLVATQVYGNIQSSENTCDTNRRRVKILRLSRSYSGFAFCGYILPPFSTGHALAHCCSKKVPTSSW